MNNFHKGDRFICISGVPDILTKGKSYELVRIEKKLSRNITNQYQYYVSADDGIIRWVSEINFYDFFMSIKENRKRKLKNLYGKY